MGIRNWTQEATPAVGGELGSSYGQLRSLPFVVPDAAHKQSGGTVSVGRRGRLTVTTSSVFLCGSFYTRTVVLRSSFLAHGFGHIVVKQMCLLGASARGTFVRCLLSSSERGTSLACNH